MAKDTYYLKHDTNASNDLKLKALRKHFGWEGMGWWWFLCETLRSEADYSLGYTEFVFDSLSEDMKCEPARVKEFIDHCIRFGLFKKEGEMFFSPRLNRDIQQFTDAKEKMRAGGLKSAAKRNYSTTFQPPSNHLNTTFQQEDNSKQDNINTPLPPKGSEDGDVVSFYESNTGRSVAPGIALTLKDLTAEYGQSQVRDAVRAAVVAEARSPVSYMRKMLANKTLQGADSARARGNGHRPNLSSREVCVNAAR